MTRVLLIGATGLVGQTVLDRLLGEPRASHIVAPTRRPLPHTSDRLTNPPSSTSMPCRKTPIGGRWTA